MKFSKYSSTSGNLQDQTYTKRILFTGDSITAGKLGRSYLDLLTLQFPDYQLVNLGQDGDTVYGIMNRTVAHLQEDSGYDLIVISAGHNDIILPAFMQKTNTHRMIVDDLKKKGSIPAEGLNEYLSTYEAFIDSIQDAFSIPIIITTMSCLNEDLSTSTNEKRFQYNQGIRELGEKNNIGLVDVGEQFNQILRESDCRDYFMSNLLESVLLDSWRSKTTKAADKLSRSRLLHLTIDGIHLNSKGAEIYSKLFTEKMKQLYKEVPRNG